MQDPVIEELVLYLKKEHIPERLIEKLQSRSQVGIKEYGVTLAESELSAEELIEYAIEEILDFMAYSQAALNKLDDERGYDGLSLMIGLKMASRILTNLEAIKSNA